MITFDLRCANGHIFEGWFEDSRAFEGQKKKKLISCPICNDTSVFKVPTKFAIKSSGNGTTSPGKEIALAEITKKAADFVENNFDNVGTEFATEALKIHYGVSELRNIRGVSTGLEEKTLKEEGVQFFKVPIPSPSETDSYMLTILLPGLISNSDLYIKLFSVLRQTTRWRWQAGWRQTSIQIDFDIIEKVRAEYKSFSARTSLLETFEEHSILPKFKEGENFNRRNTLKYFEDSAKASLRAKI